MILKGGDNVLVAHRRLFPGDTIRYFVGRVDDYEQGVVKVTGHSYVRDQMHGGLAEKMQPRTKILSLSSGTLIVYQLPDELQIDDLKFVAAEGRLFLTDERHFNMNLTEVMHGGQI